MTIDFDLQESVGDFVLEPLGTPRSQQIETTILVDLRKNPRFDTRFHAEVAAGNGNRANGIITNISKTGLRLEGGRHLVDAIDPGHDYHSPGCEVSLVVSFTLPGGMEQATAVAVRCKTVYVHSEIQDIYQVGIMFLRFETGESALTKYLATREGKRPG